MAERDPALSARNMEERNIELNEGLSAQSEVSSVDRSSSDGSASLFAEIIEEKDYEIHSCSISRNASEIEEKETAKSDRSFSMIVQIIEEKNTAEFSCSLATNAPKIDDKETEEVTCSLATNAPEIDEETGEVTCSLAKNSPKIDDKETVVISCSLATNSSNTEEKDAAVARCSYTTNSYEIEEMSSSNSTSVSEVSGTDKLDVDNSRENLRVYEAVERLQKGAETAMKDVKEIQGLCQTVILRRRNAQISTLETLIQSEQIIKEANDCDLKLQSQHVDQIFHDADSSTLPESHSVRVQISYVEAAYNTIVNKIDDLKTHFNQFGIVGIDEKLNALERAINDANDSVVAFRNILPSTHTGMKVLADIGEP